MGLTTFEECLQHMDWQEYQKNYKQLCAGEYGTAFFHALSTLRRDRLYQSAIHGQGHIERVLLFGSFLSMENRLSSEDTGLLLDACSYHDVGRIDDSKDDAHGARSALQIAELTGRSGTDLAIIQAAVTAHSPADTHMKSILLQYNLASSLRALSIANLLKDADALDRVRVCDLDPKFLRNPHSVKYVKLASILYRNYV